MKGSIRIDEKYNSLKLRNIEIRKTNYVHSPFTFGFLRKRIMLPVCWDTWDDQYKSTILEHEVTHLKNNDQWIGLVQSIVDALNYYNPIVWLLNKKIDQYLLLLYN